MKINAGLICLSGLIGYILLTVLVAESAGIDPYPGVEIPIFEGGYNLQKYYDAAGKTKSVRYRVKADYPPAEVLELYDAYFNGRGWRSTFEICQRNWEGAGNGPRAGVPPVRQLYAAWTHPEKNLTAVLWLTYKAGDTGSPNEVVVKCRLQPK